MDITETETSLLRTLSMSSGISIDSNVNELCNYLKDVELGALQFTTQFNSASTTPSPYCDTIHTNDATDSAIDVFCSAFFEKKREAE